MSNINQKQVKIFLVLLISIIIAVNSSAHVAVRADVVVVRYTTTCFDPVQVSNVFGLGFQLGADYDITSYKGILSHAFDEYIINNGATAQRIKDDALGFELKGSINGVSMGKRRI